MLLPTGKIPKINSVRIVEKPIFPYEKVLYDARLFPLSLPDMKPKNENKREASGLHPRNLHRDRYDLNLLTQSCPELVPYIIRTPYGDSSIDFFDPQAVKMLNKALLKHFYHISHWDIPDGYLAPAVPGRSDYLHYIADLLAIDNQGVIPTGNKIRCLDIGVGANCIYPLIGNSLYGWSFTGTDIDRVAIANAKAIVSQNPDLKEVIDLRWQKDPDSIFSDWLQPDDYFDLTLCNPPFHCSAEEATHGSRQKLKNLQGSKPKQPILNFGGKTNELWCQGGEAAFIRKMILQSTQVATRCRWFTTLVAKSEHLPAILHNLQYHQAKEVKTIGMTHGNKRSRIVAWRF